MWYPGAFVASSTLNIFVTLLLRTQDPGNDNTPRLSCALLALHLLGLLQLLLPSGVYAYMQWLCSAPLLWWLLAQLLGTLPPGSGAPTAQKLLRCAVVEAALAIIGLAMLLALDMPLVHASLGIISTTTLALVLLPLTAAQRRNAGKPSNAAMASAQPQPPASSSTNRNSGGGGGRQMQQQQQRAAASGREGDGSEGGGGKGGGGTGTGSSSATAAATTANNTAPLSLGPQTLLPAPMEALVAGVVAGKIMQAISAAAVGAAAGGGWGVQLSDSSGAAVLSCSALWSLTTAFALYGLPLALCMYYGLLRYAACMLVSRRSLLRRAPSLGFEEWGGPVGQARASCGGGGSGPFPWWPPSLASSPFPSSAPPSSSPLVGRRLSLSAAWGGGGADSDSDSGMTMSHFHSRLLEVGDLYRITEDSEHSSSSSDEGWRGDLALLQLLYMARTTFRGAREG
ncbi:hypothetical protein Agub_g3016, partial [Astrephomene gubernaculifera]